MLHPTMSGTFHADEIHRIMLYLPTRDVLTCMQVCKYWKTVLSEHYFWKNFINSRFNMTLESCNELNAGTLYQWSNPDTWFCYYNPDEYVARPFPCLWKCGVVHPAGLDPLSGEMKHLQGLSWSLEKLVKMKQGISLFHLECGNECSGNEGCNELDVVLFPWHEDALPDAMTVLSDIFHFHPEICKVSFTEDAEDKLCYHETDDYECEGSCLNGVFGRRSGVVDSEPDNSREDLKQQQAKFFSWLQNVMVPTRKIFAGEGKLNPIVEFFLTKLAPGWVGGVLTGQTWT